VQAAELDGLCCPECRRDFRVRRGGYCPECGQIYARETEPPRRCLACSSKRKPWDGFGFFQAYSGPFRDVILAFKLSGEIGYCRLLQHCLIEAFEQRFFGDAPELIAPVPIHNRRLVRRGFNQSLELCRALSKRLDTPIESGAIVRSRHTPTQTGLSPKERRRNLRDALHASSDLVEDRAVLVVDDIYTTGATLGACALALRKAGARRVDALVLARVADNW
jgi:ComF family protein